MALTRPSISLLCAQDLLYLPLSEALSKWATIYRIPNSPAPSSSEVIAEAAGADYFFYLFDSQAESLAQDIALYHQLRELSLPTIILISNLKNEADDQLLQIGDFTTKSDFEDFFPIITKILEEASPRALPLYSESGKAIAFLDLKKQEILDYSAALISDAAAPATSQVAPFKPEIYPATPEHLELVEEYLIQASEIIEDYGDEGFDQGLYPIAHPLYQGRDLNFSLDALLRILEIH